MTIKVEQKQRIFGKQPLNQIQFFTFRIKKKTNKIKIFLKSKHVYIERYQYKNENIQFLFLELEKKKKLLEESNFQLNKIYKGKYFYFIKIKSLYFFYLYRIKIIIISRSIIMTVRSILSNPFFILLSLPYPNLVPPPPQRTYYFQNDL